MSRRFLVVGERASYHVVSRVVDRRFVMGEEEKAEFRRLMGQLLGFSGLDCLTYCLMSNHFHLLLAVPEGGSARAGMGDAEFFRRLGCLYPREEVARVRARLEELHRESPARAVAYRERYLRRMFSLPVFVQELKRRFSWWYNRRSERRGALWEERYRSVVVEDGRALAAMAAYIDLNPVRAGLVKRPGKFRWSGFGEAVRGNPSARAGLARVVDPGGGAATATGSGREREQVKPTEVREWGEVAEAYGGMLALAMSPDDAVRTRAGISLQPGAASEDASSTVARGQVSAGMRALTEGLAIGSQAFLESLFRSHRGWFGERRRSGWRAIRPEGESQGRVSLQATWDGIGALRDLR